eukprot:3941801-Rhodomonas_salina.3
MHLAGGLQPGGSRVSRRSPRSRGSATTDTLSKGRKQLRDTCTQDQRTRTASEVVPTTPSSTGSPSRAPCTISQLAQVAETRDQSQYPSVRYTERGLCRKSEALPVHAGPV